MAKMTLKLLEDTENNHLFNAGHTLYVLYNIFLHGEKFTDNLFVQIVNICIIGIEGASVYVRLFAYFRNGNFIKGLFLHQFKKALSYNALAVLCSSVFCAFCHTKLFSRQAVVFSTMYR